MRKSGGHEEIRKTCVVGCSDFYFFSQFPRIIAHWWLDLGSSELKSSQEDMARLGGHGKVRSTRLGREYNG
jgi:hypothetical protein